MVDKFNKNIIVLAALYIIPLTGLSIDIYVPSLPAVAKYFFASHVLTQNTISVYLLGLAISQLICGNIIDHYGRRRPLLISLSGYFILSVLIILSKSIIMVEYLRLIQGICMGFSAVSARSIFLDLFTGQEYYKKASYMTIAYAIGPIIAPAIGGYLQHYLGWQSCFYFLVVYSLMGIAIVYFYIPETIQIKSDLNFKLIIRRYKEMLTHNEFVLGLICLSMLYTMSLLFAIIGPFLIQEKLHYSTIIFGNMALICALFWFLGNLANRMLLHIERQTKINISLAIIGIDLFLMLILAIFWFNLYVIVIPICVLLFFASIMFSNYFVHSPTHFPTYSATASAFMAGSFSLGSSAACLILSKAITTHSQIPLIFGYMSLLLVCIIAQNKLAKSTTI